MKHLQFFFNEQHARKNIDKHIRDNQESHLKLACEKILSLKAQLEKQEKQLKSFMVCQSPGVFFWKIEPFQEILEAKDPNRLVSGSFYIKLPGYRLQICLKPDPKSCTQRNLSVYLRILKGEYDAILPWPFRKTVKVSFIDQLYDAEDREDITISLSPANDKYCQKPIGKTDYHSYPFQTLLPLEKFQSRRYVVDDVLFLRVDISE